MNRDSSPSLLKDITNLAFHKIAQHKLLIIRPENRDFANSEAAYLGDGRYLSYAIK